MSRILFFSLFVLVFNTGITWKGKPKVCISFDDGNIYPQGGYSGEVWNEMILSQLRKHQVKAIFYVAARGLDNPDGKALLSRWNKEGNILANHSYSHWNYNKEDITYEKYKVDFLRCDSFLRDFSNFKRFYRFPYLKEGDSKEKIDLFRDLLKQKNYRHGHVTIDASDWYMNSRLITLLEEDERRDLVAFKNFYVDYTIRQSEYYQNIALSLSGRNIVHTLLLHHNLTSALFLDDLLKAYKEKGWEVVNPDDSFQDPFYNQLPNMVPAGETLTWALAKESGKFDELLKNEKGGQDYLIKEMNAKGF